MKKLMFGLAIAAVGSAFAVESSNVVGYQTCAAEGEAMIASSFIPVAGGNFKISDIQVAGAGGYGDVSMQGMESDGTFNEKHYYYLTMDGWGVEDGWYRDSNGDVPVDNTDVVAFGHGMSLSSDPEISITYSGSVTKGIPEVEWDAGDGFLGNPTPSTQYLSDIVVTGAGGYGDVDAQKMNADGTWNDIHYYYLTMDGWGVEDGWYRDSAGSDPVDETDFLAPGEAFCFHSDPDVTVTFKKVID